MSFSAAEDARASTTASKVETSLVDPSALQELGSQLESPAVAKGFARDYARMWDQRYQCLAKSIDSGNESAALDAVLSLKTSSAMVGGVRLTELARELEDAIRVRDMDLARLLLREVAESGNDTVDELQLSYNLGDS
ncbi:hypothetical protein SAMN04487914_10998 [Arthrobacter sp. ok909]|uniref:Hpt domain-containing protein n=1 Tax=Arthrobacter sp. ok909 TaxID=1761746 RepID=UPI000882C587|nr:Hpt domain-containing protein [Arthrobacter sp. ok909]SDP37488.1 hypothetical protein SAMN04487914_10998 [Arthrobacter sp. ok909]